jgi:hypothetical protein
LEFGFGKIGPSTVADAAPGTKAAFALEQHKIEPWACSILHYFIPEEY